jgi:LPXTG-motif cell wall-anchored protein
MMVRRMLTVVGLALFALVLVAPAASAQYVDDGSLTTDNPDAGPGDTVNITGTACGEPNVDVTITATQGGQSVVVGQATTGPDGTYTATITIPNTFSDGPYTISDSCGAVLHVGSAAVATTLPRTGSSNTGTLWRIAVALVAAGGLLVLTARKRSARVHVDA